MTTASSEDKCVWLLVSLAKWLYKVGYQPDIPAYANAGFAAAAAARDSC